MNGPIYSIILAAGQSSRMGSSGRNKVTHPIAGRPAILRALDTYTACGIEPHVVVVGSHADDVMATLSREPFAVLYAYQAERRGTGHAARQGARILQTVGHAGPVLVVAGDKVIERPALQRLLDEFTAGDCDMAILVSQRQGHPDLGRIVVDQDGAVLACVERRDVVQRRTLASLRALAEAGAAADLRPAALALAARAIPDERKAAIAFGRLWRRLQAGAPLSPAELLALVPAAAGCFECRRPDGRTVTLSADAVNDTPWVNLSVYLFKAPALYFGLDRLTADNAQGEEYLTDVIQLLQGAPPAGQRPFRLRPVAIDDPCQVMAFNTPAELQAIEEHYRQTDPPA